MSRAAASAAVKAASPSFSKHPVLRQELLKAFPGAAFNETGRHLKDDELARFFADAEGAVVGLEKVGETLLSRCPKLRIVAKYGVGLDNIDQEACRRRRVAVGWTGGVNRRSVSEMTLACMIGLCRRVFHGARELAQGRWKKEGGRQLSGRTVGVIGAGNVGKDLIALLKPFGCRVLVNDIVDQKDYCRERGLVEATKEALYAEAEIVTLHVPLTERTRRMIDRETLRLFKPEAFLINTSRGEIVEQAALKEALMSGRLAGAALDVYEEEPPADREFLALPNLVATPHIGGNAEEAVLAMGRSAIFHLQNFFNAS